MKLIELNNLIWDYLKRNPERASDEVIGWGAGWAAGTHYSDEYIYLDLVDNDNDNGKRAITLRRNKNA